MMKIGANLKKLRSKTKYSQQEIADILNVDRLTYINWENETTEIKSSYIPKLANIFNVDLNDLFNEKPKNKFDNFIKTDENIAQQRIVINLSDKKIAEKLSQQIEELIKILKNNLN